MNAWINHLIPGKRTCEPTEDLGDEGSPQGAATALWEEGHLFLGCLALGLLWTLRCIGGGTSGGSQTLVHCEQRG